MYLNLDGQALLQSWLWLQVWHPGGSPPCPLPSTPGCTLPDGPSALRDLDWPTGTLAALEGLLLLTWLFVILAIPKGLRPIWELESDFSKMQIWLSSPSLQGAWVAGAWAAHITDPGRVTEISARTEEPPAGEGTWSEPAQGVTSFPHSVSWRRAAGAVTPAPCLGVELSPQPGSSGVHCCRIFVSVLGAGNPRCRC